MSVPILPSSHTQRFKIKQSFRIAPFATLSQIRNFLDVRPPDFFSDGKALKYICKVDGKFSFTDPVIPHTGRMLGSLAGQTRESNNGLINWFNQNNIRSRAEYYFDSIEYLDGDMNSLDGLDIEKVVSVAIIIKSRNGKFVAFDSDEDSTKFALDFCYFPLNESRYVFTPETTLRQNFLNDRKFTYIGVGSNGDYFGTAYQVLTNIEAFYVDADTMRIEFDVDFSAQIKTFLKTLPEENRNYFFSVTTQDTAIESTVQSDNVPVLIPLNTIKWDKSVPALVEAVDNLRAFHFPSIGENAKNTVGGWEGDPFYVQFPVRVESLVVGEVSPTILNAGFQIVARKEGEEDFVLEEKIFDTSIVRKLDGIQTIDISEVKSYRDMPDEYNMASMVRDSSFDSGTKAGFLPSYASVLRYDFWNKLIADSERFRYDIFKDIENPTEAWNTLQRNGWALSIKFIMNVEGYEKFSEPFYHYWDIDCKYVGQEPDEGPIFTSTVKYEDYETGIKTNGIVPGKKTIITRTYNGDFSSMVPGYDDFYAYIFADLEGIGGVTNRRFASTEFDSEEDCPFTAYDADPDADQSFASRNVRINIFNFDRITVTTIYDESEQVRRPGSVFFRTQSPWSNRAGSILIYPKLGIFGGCFVLNENGNYTLGENGGRTLLEECPDESSS